MRAQAAEQFHRFQQIRLAFAIGSDHQQPWGFDLQLQPGVIAEVQQLQAMQPNGSGAACG
jgi:hypothetical protein